MFEESEKRPELFSTANVVLAIVMHVAFFGLCALVAACSFAPKETVIPMDLTLVLHENLDGNEDEPPPMEKPKPQPPPPKPQKVETPPPPPPEQKPLDALEKVTDKKKPEKPKEEKKKEEKKEEKKPEKKMTLEERKKAMVNRAVVKNGDPPPKPVTNGRTERKTLSDAEIQKLLMQGYKPGATEQIANSEEQRCVSLIYRAFYDKWDAPAYSTSLKEIILTVTFDMNGRVVGWNITKSSGDASADATVKRAANLVKQVYGLSDSFLRKNKTVNVSFKVKPQ